MKKNYLRDQRGVAMLFELVLVAAVLGLVGFAIYQSSQHKEAASLQSPVPAPNSAEGLANTAAKATFQESASDSTLSASAEASADELSEADSDVTNLAGASDATF